MSQIAGWIAPELKCDIGRAERRLAMRILQAVFDGKAASSATVLEAIQLPRVRRLSFRSCEQIDPTELVQI
ncbi:hypothetical protein M427DRAFT_55323 [Gonapodya prolifera JEL478]|uniref:Uncharacterized protein n=1 Tax=Gonapodya prolifera (strain JEL478) TaxID=1344416 RepID=A0A139AJU8_GONPJ|nr:hypothetical protein M427DRAFT_55323 [Gonapodya prolifera JEL478]|eukprot:KXS16675.1 hypothetical protein M427DRAFT_55323 [Gonapodya prolifera JEL478]